MQSLVLEKQHSLSLRDFEVQEVLGATDVRIQIKACGICGSDVHYFKEGRIGDFIVREPMILGHEASGVVIEVGEQVRSVKVGERVCMEPGIPNYMSTESLEGNYNLDDDVRFWATPPVHGVMRESVVHPEALTFKLPDNVSFHEGAMIEPLAVGVEAAKRAHVCPGDIALVTGAGPIGILVALSALASGCSKVVISDLSDIKLNIASQFEGIVISTPTDLSETVKRETEGKGVDILFEASGSTVLFPDIFRLCKKASRAILVGMSSSPVLLDVPLIQTRGIKIDTVFRYVNCFKRALQLVSSKKVQITSLISKTFSFADSVEAYHFAAEGREDIVKVMIDF